MPPQKQRLLLEWTPMNEHAERQKRHKDMGDKILKEVGQGPRVTVKRPCTCSWTFAAHVLVCDAQQ